MRYRLATSRTRARYRCASRNAPKSPPFSLLLLPSADQSDCVMLACRDIIRECQQGMHQVVQIRPTTSNLYVFEFHWADFLPSTNFVRVGRRLHAAHVVFEPFRKAILLSFWLLLTLPTGMIQEPKGRILPTFWFCRSLRCYQSGQKDKGRRRWRASLPP